MIAEGSAGKQGVGPDPARNHEPTEVYRRGQARPAPAGRTCGHPGCDAAVDGPRADSKFCAEHKLGKWYSWRAKQAGAGQARGSGGAAPR